MAKYSVYDLGFDKNLERASQALPGVPELPTLDQSTSTGAYTGGIASVPLEDIVNPSQIASGTLASILYSGKQTFSDTTAGYRWGVDTDGTYKFIMGTTGSSIDWNVTTANTLTIVGSVTATTGTIGGFTIGSDYIRDAGNSFGLASTVTGGDDVRFWAGAAYASRATAPFRVTEAGAITATSATITGALTTALGSVLNGTYLTSGSVTSVKVDIAARGWTQTCTFSVTDSDTVSWGGGTFTASDGTSYSISGSNTGNMAAKTYIYLDTATSTTAYQVTTTASTAVGDGKVLIAVAQNNTGEATFQVFGGNGGMNIDASSIVASSITANEIAAGAITASKINVSSLSAITADLGTITAGTITLNTSGFIRGGQTDYNTGTGFFLGYSGGAYKFSIGDSTTSNSLTWDGTVLTVNGSTVAGNDIFGSGVDGAFALDGTNTYTTYFSKSGSTYTLLMDVFATTLTMTNSAIIITNGYRIFCKTSLTIGSGSIIKWNGNDGGNGSNGTFSNGSTGGAGGSGGSSGAALTSASLYGSLAGAAGQSGGSGGSGVSSGGGYGGGNGGSGSNGSAIANSFAMTFVGNGGAGGRGGVRRPDGGSEGTGLGGSAGSASSLTASKVRPYSATFAVDMFDRDDSQNLKYLKYNGQCGGSGGGGGGAGGGGSGARCGGAGGGAGGNGSGGGTIMIAARTISNSGSIQAVGGNGGNGGNGADAANPAGGSAVQAPGGGGGGGAGVGGPGGTIVLIYTSLSGAGTVSAVAGSNGSPGTGGAGKADDSGHTGDNGADGSSPTSASSGVIIQLQV